MVKIKYRNSNIEVIIGMNGRKELTIDDVFIDFFDTLDEAVDTAKSYLDRRYR